MSQGLKHMSPFSLKPPYDVPTILRFSILPHTCIEIRVRMQWQLQQKSHSALKTVQFVALRV